MVIDEHRFARLVEEILITAAQVRDNAGRVCAFKPDIRKARAAAVIALSMVREEAVLEPMAREIALANPAKMTGAALELLGVGIAAKR